MSTISNVVSFSNAGPVAQSPTAAVAQDRLAGLSARNGNTAVVLGAPASPSPSGATKTIDGKGTIYRQQSDLSERLVVVGVRGALQLKDGDNQVTLTGDAARLSAGNGNNEVISTDQRASIRLGDGNNTFSGKFSTLNVGDGSNTLNVDGAPVTSISVGPGINKINVKNGQEVGLKLGGGITDLKGDVGGMEVFLSTPDVPGEVDFRRSGTDLIVTGPGPGEELMVVGVYAKPAREVDFAIESDGRRYSFAKDFGGL
ncbi:hypothetical protein [Bordetella sp. LUAb4]|uniref:hypothetical protein n=1 Tax=Bordetella sp. LUAb4 TaxID=2843195 RepID=UPI001E5CE32D|nr:hypothetical protein [Bordetella sp. LUAb4]